MPRRSSRLCQLSKTNWQKGKGKAKKVGKESLVQEIPDSEENESDSDNDLIFEESEDELSTLAPSSKRQKLEDQSNNRHSGYAVSIEFTPATSISEKKGMETIERELSQVPDSEQDESYIEEDMQRDSSPLSELEEALSQNESENEEFVSQRRIPHPSAPSTRRNRRPRRAEPPLTQYERTLRALLVHHPELATVWQELEEQSTIAVQMDPQPPGLSLSLLPFQREGLHWLRHQENTQFHGGILADEMGMGKTIQTIALLLTEPQGKPNLVVAPTVALVQWQKEIEFFTNNSLSVFLFYGGNRQISADALVQYDVILTTYAVLESVFRKQTLGFRRKEGNIREKSLLHSIDWFRIILDEAHNIKDRSCNTARACFALKAPRKLCLSGTPLQNRIGEMFSLLRFMEADPLAYYFCRKCPCKSLNWRFSDRRHCDQCGHNAMSHNSFFNVELLKPIQRFGAQGEGRTAFDKLFKLLKRIMLRRTKVQRADDLGLPPRVVQVRRDYFNEEEEDLYESLYSESKRKFNSYVENDVLLNNYANVFTLITRMRQMADHPDLVLRRHLGLGKSTLICKICDDEAQDAIESRCHHIYCRLCIREYIESAGSFTQHPDCPICHVTLNIDLTAPALDVMDEENYRKGSILNRIDMSKWRSSTKIEALVEELYKLKSGDGLVKSIVFSQFTSFLDLIEWRLRRAGFGTVKLDGHMTPQARAASINHFMTDPNVAVFLVSLKAGGVALNLTEASQVFIMDPWWNPSVEWQSGDRVHRIGQTRPVKITRLVIENSIESRIIELQAKKENMIRSTIDADEAALNRLSATDLQFLFNN